MEKKKGKVEKEARIRVSFSAYRGTFPGRKPEKKILIGEKKYLAEKFTEMLGK